MNPNTVIMAICLVSLTIGALAFCIHFSGGPALYFGVFFTAFAVMTAARYPYKDYTE